MSSHEQPQGLTDDHGQDGEATMLVREEQLHTGTEVRESGKVRFRKVIVTEEKTITVVVRREELHVEEVAITDGTVSVSGETSADREHTIILREEVPVVTMATRAVEAVKINVERVAGEQAVTDQVRKERIELVDDSRTTADIQDLR